jgi:1-acyl-sn-glycerol-3-phosphate acyltransferase
MTKNQENPLEIRGWYRLVTGIVGALVRALCRLEVVGTENIPEKGPCLLVTNHLHWLDTPLLAVVLPWRAYVFAGEKWESHWLLGPFLSSVGAIFVNRGEVDRKALRKAYAILDADGVLGMAPEGTRSKTGGLQKGRSGAAYIAYRGHARVLPAVITGQINLFPYLRRFRRARVRIVFGPVFDPPQVTTGEKAGVAEIGEFSEEIMYCLAAMLPPEHRGVYADVGETRPDLMALYAPYRESENA